MTVPINVVVPTMNYARMIRLLEMICSNSKLPESVLIVDNGMGFPIDIDLYPVTITVYKPELNVGVNAAWNYALSYFATDIDNHLCFLNDDIFIKTGFFSRLEASFKNRYAGIVVPTTFTDSKKEFNGSATFTTMREGDLVGPRKIRSGWCFTVRNDLVSQIPHIPTTLFTFFGDDWIFRIVRAFRYKIYQDLGSPVFHEIGQTLKVKPKIRRTLEQEREIFYTEWQGLEL